MLESAVVKRYGNEDVIVVHDREVLEIEAKLAVDFIVRWGMVAAIPDGEDTAGRQKLRLSTPEELVDRATVTAKLLMEKVREDGLIHKTVSFEETMKKE